MKFVASCIAVAWPWTASLYLGVVIITFPSVLCPATALEKKLGKEGEGVEVDFSQRSVSLV